VLSLSLAAERKISLDGVGCIAAQVSRILWTACCRDQLQQLRVCHCFALIITFYVLSAVYDKLIYLFIYYVENHHIKRVM